MKIELHAHTKEVSPCAGVAAADLVASYANAGYDAVVITDHFNYYVLEGFNIDNEDERINRYFAGHDIATAEGKKCGLKIFYGAEICLRNNGPEDYLLYCVTPEILKKDPYLYNRTLPELRMFCDENGILLFQAHPCRSYLSKADPSYLDGIEVHNGNPRHNSNNDEALAWAKQNNKLFSSGSDYHQPEDIARGGIITDRTINNEQDLKELLLSGEYKIIE